MARKRRAPSPPPPQQSYSSEEEEQEEEEEGSPRAATAQMRPQNPQPHPSATAADDAEEESDSEANSQAFQMRPVSHSPTKPTAAAPLVESDADEEEDGELSESNPEVPERVPKKAATGKSNTVEDKKRPAPEPAPSGRAKKAKAEATPAAKGKKANAETEKAAPEPTPSGKAKNPSPFHRAWSKEDSIKILEALAAHVKSESVLPKTDVLLAAVRDRLDRKDCNYTNMYEKVRRLRETYEKTVSTGVMPSGEAELRMFNLSETIWGEEAKEAMAAAASQMDSTITKSKKGQANKEKVDGSSKGRTVKEVANQNSNTQKGSKKGLEVETDRNVKSKLSMETAATATQNGDALTKGKGEKMDKEASTGNHNGGIGTEEETHEEDTERGASVPGTHRSFDELQNLYPGLAGCVERIKVQHPCGETLGRAFGFIGDEKANALESKIKALRMSAAKNQICQGDIKTKLLSMLIGLAD